MSSPLSKTEKTETQTELALEDTVAQLTAEDVVEAGLASPAEQADNARKDVYFVSGLGADERVFQLLELKGYNPVHIRWLDPEPGESISDYAGRLARQVIGDDEEPTIVGLSFGGLVAVEMAKHLPKSEVILLSSAKTASEIPPYFKELRWFPVYCVLPFKSLLRLSYGLAYWFFDLETVEERQLLRAILADTDVRFLKWALHQVVTWKNQEIPAKVTQIHGGRDRIFPPRYLSPDFLLDGGHFIVMNRAAKISQILGQII